MKSDSAKPDQHELLGNLTWARELAVRLVGEAFADDVLQETRLAALGSPQDLAESVRARPWLRVVLRRFALQRLRSESARKARERSVAKTEALPSPADLAARLEQQQLVSRMVSALREPFRSTLLLRYSEGLEPKQIALRLGIPAGTVRWRLKKAIDSLRAMLDDEHDGDRGSWAIALSPLLLAPPSQHLPVIPGFELARVSLLMKKAYAAVALVVFAGLGVWQFGMLASTETEPADELATNTTPDANSPIDATSPLAQSERLADVAAPEPRAQKPVAGWWLVGRIDGVPIGDSEKTELLIVGQSAVAQHTLRAQVEPGSDVRVNLAKIFEAVDLLPSQLSVKASHPGLRPSEQIWEVDREQRQAGFRAGGLAVFDLRLELLPPMGVIVGEVRVPDEFSAHEVNVTLLPVSDGAPTGCPIDQISCGANGQFQLQYSDSGTYHVLVTHKLMLLRPEFVEVSTVAGETFLESPIALTEGEILSGLIVWNGARADFETECELSSSGRRTSRFCDDFNDTLWCEGGYVNDTRRFTTERSGEFRITGCSSGLHRLIARAISRNGESVEILHGYGARAGWSFDLPNASLRVDFRAQIKKFTCVSNGQPIPRVGVTVRHDGNLTRRRTGDDGRIALLMGTGHPLASIEFQAPGFRTVERELGDLPARVSSEIIEMRSDLLDTGTLVIDLTGDPERQLERFSVQLQSKVSGAKQAAESNPWRASSWKRTGDMLRIAGIAPGKYDLVLAADDPANSASQEYPDTASMVMSESREVVIAAGEVSRVSIELRLGGRLWIPAIYGKSIDGIPTGVLRYRIANKQGKVAKGRWVTSSGTGLGASFTGGIYQIEDAFFEPPLRAGPYTLELWRAEDEGDLVATPFKIVAGEVTALEISDPH